MEYQEKWDLFRFCLFCLLRFFLNKNPKLLKKLKKNKQTNMQFIKVIGTVNVTLMVMHAK